MTLCQNLDATPRTDWTICFGLSIGRQVKFDVRASKFRRWCQKTWRFPACVKTPIVWTFFVQTLQEMVRPCGTGSCIQTNLPGRVERGGAAEPKMSPLSIVNQKRATSAGCRNFLSGSESMEHDSLLSAGFALSSRTAVRESRSESTSSKPGTILREVWQSWLATSFWVGMLLMLNGLLRYTETEGILKAQGPIQLMASFSADTINKFPVSKSQQQHGPNHQRFQNISYLQYSSLHHPSWSPAPLLCPPPPPASPHSPRSSPPPPPPSPPAPACSLRPLPPPALPAARRDRPTCSAGLLSRSPGLKYGGFALALSQAGICRIGVCTQAGRRQIFDTGVKILTRSHQIKSNGEQQKTVQSGPGVASNCWRHVICVKTLGYVLKLVVCECWNPWVIRVIKFTNPGCTCYGNCSLVRQKSSLSWPDDMTWKQNIFLKGQWCTSDTLWYPWWSWWVKNLVLAKQPALSKTIAGNNRLVQETPVTK